MRLSYFLMGSLVATVAAIVAAMMTDMVWYAVIGLAVSVWVTAQVLYVVLIGIMARKAKTNDDPQSHSPGWLAGPDGKATPKTLSDTDRT
ncbi:hypothetical protein [Loktanella sp. SALINAS62]|uniref:hypothetical protein n=1 Tax=Loktanella sp. SALINAS62 TaxID=2706124 RepID=UPI001B8C9905|nr:hypothetical protein [Loktanella sp. SALINAS62]MBS1302178.1 hypothetical protein [Loktanella sp. SALINAS62]